MALNIGRTQKDTIKTVLFVTLIIVYFLIWVGAMVRASGAGLGCPDWPTCFGRLIPPTSEDQLPPNYKEIYAVPGHEVIFNVRKTWTEYINRLFGVLTGLAVTASMVVTFKLRKIKEYKPVFWASALAFVLTVIEGWIGAKVVASGLKPIIITLHMLLALLIVYSLLFAFFRLRLEDVSAPNQETYIKNRKMLYYGTFVLATAAILQLFLGIQVRQQVDILMNVGNSNRESWVNMLNVIFYIHRSFSWVLLITTGYLLYKLKDTGLSFYKTFLKVNLAIILAGMFSGYILNYHAFPFWIQPFHLLIATLLSSIPFILFLYLKFTDSKLNVGYEQN